MLLAGDVGGTKTFLGLFARGATRPDAVDVRSYRTLDFPDLGALSPAVSPRDLDDAGRHRSGELRRRGSGHRHARALTNVPWVVDLDALRSEVPIPRAYLLNDLEALAWSVPVLDA